MFRKLLYFVVLVIFSSLFLNEMGLSSRSLATDGDMSDVFVCTENNWYDCNQTYPSGSLVSYPAYLEQVLANEWHSSSELEAFKAGVVAIRSFTQRTIGCGAYTGYNYSPYGGWPSFRILFNGAQHYSPVINAVTNEHVTARMQTDGILLYRADGEIACAKYDANTGNPTRSCSSNDCPNSNDQDTLWETSDPVASNNYVSARHSIGMSQNGSAAWAIGQDSWDYYQILSHYYHKVLIGVTDDNRYRWNWLDVGDEITFTGYSGGNYEEYYAPKSTTPHTMGVGLTHSIPMHIQNTGNYTWWNGLIYLSYHWYDGSGNNVVIWNGKQTALGKTVSPGEDIVLHAQVTPPSPPGTYVLKWDMVKNNGTWFSQAYNRPTQNVVVEVKYFNEKLFLPLVLKQ